MFKSFLADAQLMANQFKLTLPAADLPPDEEEATPGTLPPDPDTDGGTLPPDDDEDPGQAPLPPAASTLVHVPDEVLDPDQLVPASSILARLEALPVVVQAKARAAQLVAIARNVGQVRTAEERDTADAVRDQLKKHATQVDEFFGPLCDAANKLHKGATGLRSFCQGDVLTEAKRLGDAIAASIRREQEAEAARRREEAQRQLEAERARLKAEADAAEAERQRLAQEAEAARQQGDAEAAAVLAQQAEQEALNASLARQEAATAVAPPVAAREVVQPAGASTRANWQAVPASATTADYKQEQAAISAKDKSALIVHVAALLAKGDGSLMHLLDVNWTAAKDLAKSQKEQLHVPGLKAINPPVYSKR